MKKYIKSTLKDMKDFERHFNGEVFSEDPLVLYKRILSTMETSETINMNCKDLLLMIRYIGMKNGREYKRWKNQMKMCYGY